MMLVTTLLLLSAVPPQTIAAQSGYIRTGRYAEVEALCVAYQKAFPQKVRCEKFGTTPMGRAMLYLTLSNDGVLTAKQTEQRKRPVVFFQGGIHAGEIDGKDAGFWMVRDLLNDARFKDILSAVTVVFVPVLNVDGHERFAKNNRPNQNGPEEMGFRVTAQNLNLNRDYAKAEAPETQAVLRLMHAYDPVLFVDLHVTDGAKFQHDVSVTVEPWATGPKTLRDLGVALKDSLLASLKESGHLPVGFYPSFIREDDPASGFAYGWPPPRFATAYWAANNRFGLLVETHSWKDYKTRVNTTYDVCMALLQQALKNAVAWRAAQREVDLAESKRGDTDVVLLTEASKVSKPLDFLGYAYEREKSSVTGAMWVKYDDAVKTTWKVPLFETQVPALTLRAPQGGYVIPPPHAAWMKQKLSLHGIVTQDLSAALPDVQVDVFRGVPQFSAQSYEGRQTLKVSGEWKPERQSIPAHALLVPVAQPKAALVMHLLEPSAPDSFLQWGFFNAHFERKEYLEAYLAEAFAREALQKPEVKAAFELAMKDQAFAKSAEAKLAFFAERHPSADALKNLYPVFRYDNASLVGGTGR
jgi:Zinc carboxypeptidase